MAKAKSKSVVKTISSSTICRTVLDTQDVIKDQFANLLVTELVTNGSLTRDACKTLCAQLSSCVDKQTDALIDRILNEFNGK